MSRNCRLEFRRDCATLLNKLLWFDAGINQSLACIIQDAASISIYLNRCGGFLNAITLLSRNAILLPGKQYFSLVRGL